MVGHCVAWVPADHYAGVVVEPRYCDVAAEHVAAIVVEPAHYHIAAGVVVDYCALTAVVLSARCHADVVKVAQLAVVTGWQMDYFPGRAMVFLCQVHFYWKELHCLAEIFHFSRALL